MTEQTTPVAVPAGMQEAEFFFRKEDVLDPATGKPIGETKKLPAFKTIIPGVTPSQLMGYLVNEESNESKLIVDLVQNAIYLAARSQINEWRAANKDASEVSPAAIDAAALDFSVIANTPSESVGRQGVTDEQWKSFYETYFATMTAQGEQKERAANQVTVITGKFKSVKDVKVLERMQEKLALFAAAAGEDGLREHVRAYTLTVNRLEAAIKKASETSLDDIG